jgi:hypothetical protein
MFYRKFFNLSFLLWLFFYLAIFFYALNISFSYVDSDFPWHLRIGQQIINEHAAPTIEYYYNNALNGKNWVDHEWLFNAIFYYIYNNFGYISLNVFFAVLVTLIFIILKIFTQTFFINRCLNKKQSGKSNIYQPNRAMLLIMSLEAYALLAMSPFVGTRMQIAGNLLFVIILFLLELFNKKQEKKYLIALPFIFIFWTNLHGSFLIGLAVLWAWLGLKTIEPVLSKYKLFQNIEFHFLNKQSLIFSYFVIITTTFSTLLNPYGLGLYSFLSAYSSSYYLIGIAEWRPFYYLPILYHQLVILAIFLAVLILSVYSLTSEFKTSIGFKKYITRLNPWFIFLSILFFMLALKSKRHFPLFLISSFSLIIQFIYFEFAIDLKNNFSTKLKAIAKIIIILIFISLSFYFITTAKTTNRPFAYHTKSKLPIKLVEFIKNNPELISKKVFNEYSWGGYFLWALPEMKLFIDGRMPQVKYNNHSLLEEYKDFFEEAKLEEKLVNHQIELIVLQKDYPVKFSETEKKFLGLDEKALNAESNYLRNFLEASDDWNKIYEDNLGEIYISK